MQKKQKVDDRLQAQRQTLEQLRKEYYDDKTITATEYVDRALYGHGKHPAKPVAVAPKTEA